MSTNKQNIKQVWKQILDVGLATEHLQIESLGYFLQEMGYSLEDGGEDGDTFHITAIDPLDSNNPTHMPFDTAVVLHNGTTWKTNGTIIEARGFTFIRQAYKKAFDNKILHTVYLQRIKGGIKAQRNWVRFKEVYDLGEELERTY